MGAKVSEVSAWEASAGARATPDGCELDIKGGESDRKGGESDRKGGESDRKGGESDRKGGVNSIAPGQRGTCKDLQQEHPRMPIIYRQGGVNRIEKAMSRTEKEVNRIEKEG